MNQKTAKKLRQLLRGALIQRDGKPSSVTAPGVVEASTIKTKQLEYTENERNRKMSVVELTENELVQAAAWAKTQDEAKWEELKLLNPGKDLTDVTFSPTPVPKTKKVLVARGTMMVSTGTVRGTYLALKKGLGKKKL